MMRIPTVREPTQGQLLAMAYVDGELTELSRRKLEELSHDHSAVNPTPFR